MTISKQWLLDAAERVGSSFVEAVIGAALSGAVASGLNASTGHVLLVAGLTAAATTLKALLAPLVKGTVSPASLIPAVKHHRDAGGIDIVTALLVVTVVVVVLVLLGVTR